MNGLVLKHLPPEVRSRKALDSYGQEKQEFDPGVSVAAVSLKQISRHAFAKIVNGLPM